MRRRRGRSRFGPYSVKRVAASVLVRPFPLVWSWPWSATSEQLHAAASFATGEGAAPVVSGVLDIDAWFSGVFIV
jgi:hypothetical protein